MRQTTLLFRDATGTFYNDRWKPLIEGTLNVILSIAFVLVFPESYNIVGVIVATIITNLLICHIVEPYVLYKYAYKSSAKGYYLRNYAYIALFTAGLVGLNFCLQKIDNSFLELLVNGCIAVALALAISLIVLLTNKDFKHYMKKILSKFKSKRSKS
jgi:peptidoglycan biosynthesis protein MviN/MurJ (putative lipid II flippase)